MFWKHGIWRCDILKRDSLRNTERCREMVAKGCLKCVYFVCRCGDSENLLKGRKRKIISMVEINE